MAMSVLQHDVYRFLQCSKVLWSRSLTSLPSAGPLLNISKTDLNDLPLLKFSGKVCVIRSTGDEERFQKEIDQMCRADIVGFGTETNHQSYHPRPPSLIHMSTDNLSILWRLRKYNTGGYVTTWVSPALTNIFMCPDILKVGHGVTGDAIELLKHYQLEVYNMQDSFQLATQLGLQQLSLRGLVGMFLKRQLSKKESLSNWEIPFMKEDQMIYASTNAWASLKVYQFILKHMEEIDTTCPPAVKRAWSLLKLSDQEVILNKLSETDRGTRTFQPRHPASTGSVMKRNTTHFNEESSRFEKFPNNRMTNSSFRSSSGSESNQGGIPAATPVYVREEYERKVTHTWYKPKNRPHQAMIMREEEMSAPKEEDEDIHTADDNDNID